MAAAPRSWTRAPHRSVPNLLAALGALDIDVEQVDYVLLTHVHLDHAGGAGALMAVAAAGARRSCIRAARPTSPIRRSSSPRPRRSTETKTSRRSSATPCPFRAGASSTVADGERLALGARTLEFLHTPGHALHHVCILDRDTRELFTGDTFGISYRESDTAAGPFIFPDHDAVSVRSRAAARLGRAASPLSSRDAPI